MHRRTVLARAVALGAVALAGCGGGSEPEIVMEYTAERIGDEESIPDQVIGPSENATGRDPRSIEWYTVNFWITKGSFDAVELLEHTKVIVTGEERDPIAVQITAPDQRFLFSTDQSYSMSEGTQGVIYFANQDALPNDHRFVPDALESQVGVAVRERDQS